MLGLAHRIGRTMKNRKPEPFMVIGNEPGTTSYWLRLTGDPKHLTKLGRPLIEKGWRVKAEDNAAAIEQARAGELMLVTNDPAVALDYMPIKRWLASIGWPQLSTLPMDVLTMLGEAR